MTRDFTPNEDVMVLAVLSSNTSIGSTRDISLRMSSMSEIGIVEDLDASVSIMAVAVADALHPYPSGPRPAG